MCTLASNPASRIQPPHITDELAEVEQRVTFRVLPGRAEQVLLSPWCTLHVILIPTQWGSSESTRPCSSTIPGSTASTEAPKSCPGLRWPESLGKVRAQSAIPQANPCQAQVVRAQCSVALRFGLPMFTPHLPGPQVGGGGPVGHWGCH